MNLPSALRVICVVWTALVLAARADASAELSTSIPHPTNPNLGLRVPVTEVRGDVPYIEVGGKPRTVRSEELTLTSGSTIDPHWIFASRLKVQLKSVKFVGVPGGPFNKDLLFSVDLESPVALDEVWIALGLNSEKVGGGIIVQEVGSLLPYTPRTVAIYRQLNTDFGETKCFWHIFIRGREVLNSLMVRDHVEADLRYETLNARSKVKNADAAPYLTYPPRKLSGAPDRVTLELKLSASGSVDHVLIVGRVDPNFKKGLLDAVSHWWFLPKVVEGVKVDTKMTVDVDLSGTKNWSNELVQPVAVALRSNPTK